MPCNVVTLNSLSHEQINKEGVDKVQGFFSLLLPKCKKALAAASSVLGLLIPVTACKCEVETST